MIAYVKKEQEEKGKEQRERGNKEMGGKVDEIMRNFVWGRKKRRREETIVRFERKCKEYEQDGKRKRKKREKK